jgi:hypothetical protein
MDFITTLCHELLEHGGLGTFVVALLAMIMFHIGIVLVFSRIDASGWPDVIRKLILKPTSTRELEHSTFFQSMFFLKMGVIQRLNITCKLRNKIFTRLLYIKVDMIETVIREFIAKEESWKDLEIDDMEIVLKSVLAESDIRWQKEAKERGIPEVAIDLFKKYNLQKMSILDEVILSASLSKYTSVNNHERVLIFLDALSTREIKSFDSLDKVLNELNGHLSKVVFEGEKCTHCDPLCPHQDKVE